MNQTHQSSWMRSHPTHPKRAIENKIFLTLELFYWFQAGRLTYFSVLPYELYIRINEFILSNTTLPKRSIHISCQIVLLPFCSTQKFIGPNFNLRQLMNLSINLNLHAGTRFIIPSFFSCFTWNSHYIHLHLKLYQPVLKCSIDFLYIVNRPTWQGHAWFHLFLQMILSRYSLLSFLHN